MDNWFEEIPVRIEIENEKLILTLWEARWHGFGKWTIERRAPHSDISSTPGFWVQEVAHGWWRPPKGWKWHEIEIKDYDGKPMVWWNNFGRGGFLTSFKVTE